MRLKHWILNSLFVLLSVSAYAQGPVFRIFSSGDWKGCDYTNSFSVAVPGYTLKSVYIVYGDGTNQTIPNPDLVNSPSLMAFTHTYASAGTYNYTITATYSTLSAPNTNLTYTVTQSVTVIAPSISELLAFSVSGTFPDQTFTFNGFSFFDGEYSINFGDGTSATYNAPLYQGQVITTHTYSMPGSYTVVLTKIVRNPSTGAIICSRSYSQQISMVENSCCSNFSPEPGKRYWVSAWVQEETISPVLTYSNKVYVELEFVNSTNTSSVKFYPSGDIIDNWQRIYGDFIVPAGTTEMRINMLNLNTSGQNAYFDDIRIHPFNGSMKSYVYDPETLQLSAELDDNNYATFYEYDKEGQLIRIKKETARGIMTIQETRSSNPKKE